MLERPSALVLVLANLLPLVGVLWLDWSVLEVLLLYWTESVVIGVVNVLRMACSAAPNTLRGSGEVDQSQPVGARITPALVSANKTKIFLIPFFILHFGGFCFGHLSAVVFILGPAWADDNLFSALPPLTEPMFWIAVLAIFASHLFSFFVNFLGRGENRRTGLADLMQRPYGRIVVMHLTVIAGAYLVEQFNSPLALLLALIVVKTAVDLKLHARERDMLGDARDLVLQQNDSHPNRA